MFRNFKLNTFYFVLITASFSLLLWGCGKMSSMSMDDLLNSAAGCAENGKWSQAVKFASTASDRDPTNTAALLLLAIAYEHTGKPDAALEAAKNAVKTNPDSFMAQYTLGRLYAHEQNRLQDSIEPLLRAAKLAPDDVDALILLAECSLKLGLPKTPEYYSRLLQMPKLSKRADLWNQIGVHFAEKGKKNDAVKCFNTAYVLAPDNPVICLNFGVYLDSYLGRADKAKSYYQRFIDLTAKNLELEPKRQEIKKRLKEVPVK